ncbi:MAG: DUF4403 family protein [Gemmatimonadetes bacterium]|nr:DUF4403 family protein [Gemmatimonadota bacterium]
MTAWSDPDSASSNRGRISLLVLLAMSVVGLWWFTRSDGSLRPDRPAVSAEDAEPLELPVSSLPVPVQVDLVTLLDEVEKHVPSRWGDLSQPAALGDSTENTAAIELARSPFRASLEGNAATLSAIVAYRVRGTYHLPLLPDVNYACATDPEDVWPRLEVVLHAPIDLASDWSLRATTEVQRLDPLTTDARDQCEVTALGIDIADRVASAARDFVESQTPAIDSIVGTADVRSSFEDWWSVLAEPIQLDDDIWLEIRPEAVSRGPIQGQGSVVRIPASLEARPRIVVGDRPESIQRPLPPLGAGVGDGPLQILVEAFGEYGETSRLLTEALAGIRIEAGGRTLEVRAARLSGIGAGRVALEAEIAGTVAGRLFLVGTPIYDAESGYASVPDLAFSVATTSLLVSGASWIADAGLEALLQERARWPVDAVVEWAAERLHEGLNRSLTPGVRLEGTVHDVEVIGVRATPDGLVVGAAATADATLIITEEN